MHDPIFLFVIAVLLAIVGALTILFGAPAFVSGFAFGAAVVVLVRIG